MRWRSAIGCLLAASALAAPAAAGEWADKARASLLEQAEAAFDEIEIAVVGTVEDRVDGVDGSWWGSIAVERVLFGAAAAGDRLPLLVDEDHRRPPETVGARALFLLVPGRDGFFATRGFVSEGSPLPSSTVLGHAARLLCHGSRSERAIAVLTAGVDLVAGDDEASPRIVACRTSAEPIAAVQLDGRSTTPILLDGAPIPPSILARRARWWSPATLLSVNLDDSGRVGDVATVVPAPMRIGEHVARSVADWRVDPELAAYDRALLVVLIEPIDADKLVMDVTVSCGTSVERSRPGDL